MTTPDKKPVNPKTAALIAFLGAGLVLAVAYYPPLLPVCQSLGFCDATVVEQDATPAS